MVEGILIGWAVVAVVGGFVFAHVARKYQESDLATPLDVEDEQGPVYPVLYPLGITVRTRVNQWPDGKMVVIGTQGVVLGVTSSADNAEPVYHVRWDNGVVSLLPESAMDSDVTVLHRAAA